MCAGRCWCASTTSSTCCASRSSGSLSMLWTLSQWASLSSRPNLLPSRPHILAQQQKVLSVYAGVKTKALLYGTVSRFTFRLQLGMRQLDKTWLLFSYQFGASLTINSSAYAISALILLLPNCVCSLKVTCAIIIILPFGVPPVLQLLHCSCKYGQLYICKQSQLYSLVPSLLP